MSDSATRPVSTDELARLRHRLIHAAVRHPDLFLEYAASDLIAVACSTAHDGVMSAGWTLGMLRKIVLKLPDHELGKACPK